MRFLRGARESSRASGHPLDGRAVYTAPDADAPFVRFADDAISLGPAQQPDAEGTLTSAYVLLTRIASPPPCTCKTVPTRSGWTSSSPSGTSSGTTVIRALPSSARFLRDWRGKPRTGGSVCS